MGRQGRKRAIDRDERWQRWLWPRFMTAFALRPLDRPWQQFLRRGHVSVRSRRILAGSGRGRRHRNLLWGAVSSSLAAEILGVAGPRRPRPSAIRLLLQRFRLLVLALPRLPGSHLAVARRRHPVSQLVRKLGVRLD